MNEPGIRLQFPNVRSAYDAFDTFEELGYSPEMTESGDQLELLIQMDRNDVQSALEIMQACGGNLVGTREPGVIEMGIPAHLVAEDFSEAYTSGITNEWM